MKPKSSQAVMKFTVPALPVAHAALNGFSIEPGFDGYDNPYQRCLTHKAFVPSPKSWVFYSVPPLLGVSSANGLVILLFGWVFCLLMVIKAISGDSEIPTCRACDILCKVGDTANSRRSFSAALILTNKFWKVLSGQLPNGEW
ncbi:uncharacterized protein EV420DRAFT_1483101 [Desarmillaria tabescens]|uniref:Uncharacterized protein n=1 Tax=Armillaria tabescens TaxID=1929756 RepID=A0AA39MWU5_ARMTA|nr:uncharacterized protein EV420DRAFT_1483101 [Desarmillaria tabescens]KAK0449567.1 hypothetical protein EV420DRAFT_1483101 [Desarmillaria tabescens]